MGNCSLKGVTDTAKGFNFIRIMTDSGEILKLKGPKLVGEVIQDFPGYRIYGKGHISSPLFDHEELLGGQFYYLLPFIEEKSKTKLHCEDANEKEPVRKSSAAALELVSGLANGSALEVLPPPQKGVWRVKLAITPKQLEEILAEEVNTEALIEQMRLAAAASSTCATPRRTKSSWGLMWKPILANVLKVPTDQEDEVQSPKFSQVSLLPRPKPISSVLCPVRLYLTTGSHITGAMPVSLYRPPNKASCLEFVGWFCWQGEEGGNSAAAAGDGHPHSQSVKEKHKDK
ncbi:hypothetical protein ACH5RR_041735 [Cinchona calisaya]|uniref:Uncharacterized protein n=1 Tax=Cinchona calisaya TaxID=153742 RepID=A0ABD2XV02_9GENT